MSREVEVPNYSAFLSGPVAGILLDAKFRHNQHVSVRQAHKPLGQAGISLLSLFLTP